MIYTKLIHGWVAQRIDSETGDCIEQQFMADAEEEVQRQDEEGQPIEGEQAQELANTEKECATDMVQP